MCRLFKYIKYINAGFILIESDCSCLQSCNIPRLWLNICQYPHCCTLPGKHYVALLKGKLSSLCEENVVLIFTNYLELCRKPNHFTLLITQNIYIPMSSQSVHLYSWYSAWQDISCLFVCLDFDPNMTRVKLFL